MKFLIAGFGSIGRRHLRNLLALGERDILLYRSRRSTLPEDEIAEFPVETDLQAALAHRPDAVIISNPTALHLDVAIPAAEAGCHILMEKPISHTLERVDELRAALQRGGGCMVVGFQFRFHPTLRLADRLLKEGAIGEVQSARVHWGEYLPNWHPWEDYRQGYAARPELGGGVIRTLCHPFDYLRWLLGDVSALWAFASNAGLNLPVEDTAEVGLRFANGVIGSVHVDYLQQPAVHTLEVIGTAGTLRWNNADASLSVYNPAAQNWNQYSAPEGFDRNWLFLDELRHFLAVARGEEQPLCSLEDGIQAMRIVTAALESAQDGSLKKL